MIDTICPHINFYFPNACRLSPASQIAERRAVPSEILLFLQGNWKESEKDIEKNERLCVRACMLHLISVPCMCVFLIRACILHLTCLTCMFTPQLLVFRVGS